MLKRAMLSNQKAPEEHYFCVVLGGKATKKKFVSILLIWKNSSCLNPEV